MQPFLYKCAEHIFRENEKEVSNVCIVLPNRRAALFLKKHFASLSSKPIWSPEIFAIEDFVEKLCGVQVIDSMALLFEFYEAYREKMKGKAEPFDEFCHWGKILLQDFNDIDLGLVDAEQLFGNLSNIKEIENWSLAEENLTDFQKNYLEFFSSLGGMYQSLRKRLEKKNLVYEGLANRIVAENITEKLEGHEWKKIYFLGFNALNPAEEKIISFLVNSGKAETLWDADEYYLNDPVQEAGKFLRDNIPSLAKDPKNVLWKENLLSTEAKNITIIGAAKNAAQAKGAGDIIQKLLNENADMTKTAIVLADEKLLFPVLHSLPDKLTDVNVTMGYPLKNTPPAGLVEILFAMQETAKRFSKSRNTAQTRFYHKDLLRLLSHPYVKALVSDSNLAYTLSTQVTNRNYVFASADDLKKFAEETQQKDFEKIAPLLKSWENINDVMKALEYLVEVLKSSFMKEKSKTSLETEYIFGFSKIFTRLQSLVKEYDIITEIKTLRSILRQIISTTNLPFYGEPLTGLQIMGVLETRTLDFDNLIVLSVNEDILPSGKTKPTFIPFDLKRVFGLPTYSHKDAVFAYHFYRMIQRTKNIFLFYNTETDGLGSGEKSRYLAQLQYELPLVNKNAVMQEKILMNSESTVRSSEIKIEKTKEVLEKLNGRIQKGLSPSALNNYKNCSLQYYFRYIAGLKETEEVEETVGADTMGTVIHKVLEELYSPHKKKVLKANDVKEMKKIADELIEKHFAEDYSKTEMKFGKNLLSLKVASSFVRNFLDSEIKFIEEGNVVTIEEIEFPLNHSLSIGSKKINLTGNADRIDRTGNALRIIDYKTGITEDKELKFENWEDITNETLLNKSFQLMMYAYMYMSATKQKEVQSGIITFRELSAGFKTVKINGSDLIDEGKINAFETELKKLVENILDVKQSFTQTTDLDICAYCSFAQICNR